MPPGSEELRPATAPPVLTNWAANHGFEQTYVDLPGLRMETVVAGPEDGPLTILLHGFPETAYSWRYQIGPLAAAGNRVIAPNQRGYDGTDPTGPYDFHTLVGDITHLMDACGREQADLVGHDWGGLVAWMLAALHPSRVGRLVAVNAPLPIVGQQAIIGGDWRQALRSAYILFFQIRGVSEWWLRRRNFLALRRALQLTSRPGTFSDSDLAEYVRAWSRPGRLTAMLGWYGALGSWSVRQIGQGYATRISVPTRILWGERDFALGIDLARRTAARLDNGALFRFPEGTHWVQQEYPDAVTDLILAHLRS